jgi:hypothetical protein
MRAVIVVSFVIALATGCVTVHDPAPVAGARPAATAEADQAIDPVGIYDFTTYADGAAIQGEVRIRRTEAGGLAAYVLTTASDPIVPDSVVLEGARVLMEGGDGFSVDMRIEGDEVSGTWAYMGMASSFTGRRR